jgi:hypothetical protein
MIIDDKHLLMEVARHRADPRSFLVKSPLVSGNILTGNIRKPGFFPWIISGFPVVSYGFSLHQFHGIGAGFNYEIL